MNKRPATEKQFGFIKRLVAERHLNADVEKIVARHRRNAMAGTMTTRDASGLIEVLLAQPKKPTQKAADPTPGVYSYAGDQYVRVYFGQKNGRTLAKRIHMEQDGGDWTVTYEYLGLAARVLTPDTTPERLSLEEVGSLGITTNHCLMCGRRLDDPESVDRGIGPVCARKYGSAEGDDVEPDPDGCVGGKCTDILNLCSRHQSQYQARYGRASNE